MINDNIANNKLLWIAVILGLMLVIVFVGGPVLIDRITQKVIHKMQKEYAPGPYAPGFDPDRVDPKFWRDVAPKVLSAPPVTPPVTPPSGSIVQPPTDGLPTLEDWNKIWEKYRVD